MSATTLGKKNISANLAANVLLGAIGFATGTIAARLLGPTGRGELAAIQIWPAFLAVIAGQGLTESVVYFSARDAANAKRYLFSTMALALLTSGALAGVGFFLFPLLLRAQSAETRAAATFYVLFIPAITLAWLPVHAFRGCHRFDLWNGCRIIGPFAWLAILIGAWTLHIRQVSPLIHAYLAALVVLGLFETALALKVIPGKFGVWPSLWPRLIRYGAPCTFTGVSQSLNLRMDQMLLAALVAPRDLGLYVAAVAWATGMNAAVNALNDVFFPKVASISEQADRHSLFARGLRMGASLSLFVGVIWAIATPFAIPFIFGQSFRPAVACALVLVPASIVSGMNTLMEGGLRGLGRPKAALVAELSGLVVTIISLALMLRPLGILGAAVASLLGYSATFAVGIYQGARATGFSLATLARPRPAEIAATVKSLGDVPLRMLRARRGAAIAS